MILNNAKLRSDFALACSREHDRHLRSRDEMEDPVSYEQCMVLYREIMDKVCNARFGEVLKNYCEQKALKGKGKLTLRAGLCAQNAMGSGGAPPPKSGSDAAVTSRSSSSALALTAPVSTHRFNILVPGSNGAIAGKVLGKVVFVLAGRFDEVSSTEPATKALAAMITSFGGKANKRLTKNTTYLLAGRDTTARKIKDAVDTYKARVISLRRLEKILRGTMTFDQLREEDVLTSDNFKGNNYQPAGSPTETSSSSETSAESDTSSNEAITSEASTSIPTNVS